MLLGPIAFHRAGQFLARVGLKRVARGLDYASRLLFCCWFPHDIRVGANLVLGYGGLGIVIHKDAVLGDNVHIDQHVTIGGTGTVSGVPRICSGVYIGAGAKVLGPILVGERAVIGANAVVLENVPCDAVVVGVPAKVVKVRSRGF